MANLSSYRVSGTNNSSKQVSVTKWNDLLGDLDDAAGLSFDGSDLVFTATDGVRYTLTKAIEAGTMFKRPVFGWDQDAGLDSARFASMCEITATTGLIAYSPRKLIGAHGDGDGEVGMRLDVVSYTLNTAAETVTLGTPVTVFTPADFATGKGAMWQCQLLRLSSGRILLFAQELNSPDGTYTHVDSRYDVVLFYSDDNGATWSAKQVLLLGQSAHTSFGLADYNAAAAGLQIPAVNVAVQMGSGRIVIVGFLPQTPHYLASMFTDDGTNGTTGWTVGTPLAYPDANYNEPSLALASDGSLIASVRHEATDARGIFTSTNGATWAFSRLATDAPIQNVASAAYGNGTAVYVAGATTTTDNRRGFKFYKTTNGGAGFTLSTDDLFEETQRIGYSFLTRLSSGHYALIYEVTSTQAPGSFNKKASLGMAVFNAALLNGAAVAAEAHDSTTYTAATEYSLYETYVTGDGGTIQDVAACKAAISAAIAGNYYSRLGFAVSPRWGHKGLGTSSAKLYSLNRIATSSVDITGGAIALDTTTYAYPVLVVPAGSFFTFAGMKLRNGSTMGAVMLDSAADTGGAGGIGISWTDSVAHYMFAGGTFSIGGTGYITSSPQYSTTANQVSHFIIDYDERMGIHGKDGVDLQAVGYFPKYSVAGATFTIKIDPVAGTNRHVPEMWFFNNASRSAIRQCGADVGGRY